MSGQLRGLRLRRNAKHWMGIGSVRASAITSAINGPPTPVNLAAIAQSVKVHALHQTRSSPARELLATATSGILMLVAASMRSSTAGLPAACAETRVPA